jgi:peptidoglycan/xylan/chitin deacetylase (PgdA/CDA1 family)
VKKRLLLTYDYELFLGPRSGALETALLGPARKTLDLLNRYGVKGIFFVDTTYLARLAENRDRHEASARDFEGLRKQLREAVAGGHDVFPHIHPHWLDAHYLPAENEWALGDVRRYRFHACAPEERARLFAQSMEALREALAGTGYAPDGFRAGGWCLQPFSDFREFFLEHGIRYDMTVLPGMYSFTDAQYFDFTAAPEKEIYRFDGDECTEEPNGPFVQFAISTLRIGPAARILNRLWNGFAARAYGDNAWLRGSGYASKPLPGAPAPKRPGYDILEGRRERIAVELLSPFKLRAYKKFLREHDYMHFISHPKMITEAHHRYFEAFLRHATETYALETDFRKMIPPSSDSV